MWDYHLHSSFSHDSDQPLLNMAAECSRLGFDQICFTEHADFESYSGDPVVPLDVKAYQKEIEKARSLFPDMDIKMGLEAGAARQTLKYAERYLQSLELDFIILSVHEYDQVDPYNLIYPAPRLKQIFQEYLEQIDYVLKHFDHFSVLGHIDYLSKIEQFQTIPMDYKNAADKIDSILTTLVQKGKGIEVNTASNRFSKNFGRIKTILRRYWELGGEIVTIGTDSHRLDTIGFMAGDAINCIKDAGFGYVAIYSDMRPQFQKLT